MTNEQIKIIIEQQTHLTAMQVCSCRFNSCFLLLNNSFLKCWAFRKCAIDQNGKIDETRPLTDLEQENYLKDKCEKILRLIQCVTNSGGKNVQQNQ